MLHTHYKNGDSGAVASNEATKYIANALWGVVVVTMTNTKA